VIDDAERQMRARGNENHGFLSWSHGFVPRITPLSQLSPAFAAWDQAAAELPVSYRDLTLRRRLDELPVLEAGPESLADAEVLRGCALLAILAQAYWNVEVTPPRQLPAAISRPWAQLRQRLGREQEVLSYIDLIVYNWRVVDSTQADPLRVENLRLLLPTVDNQEERVFYLTQLEMLAACGPLVKLVTLAQDAVLVEDKDALEEALLGVITCLRRIVCDSLPKINPNAYGSTFVDPVVWAKTVAPFAVPIHAGDQGPSGTSSPIFNTLDLFFGRKRYQSFLGREIQQLRSGYPASWRAFLQALDTVRVSDYIERANSRSLAGAWREAFEMYVGADGFLGRHRMKVYGFLELAFKVGRSVTIGGFGGVFKDRTWDQVDNELEASRGERLLEAPSACREARIQARTPAALARADVRQLTLDVSDAGVRYRAGDRCAIYPENGPELIDRTLSALGATGDEPVRLTDEWKAAARVRRELTGKTTLGLRDVLRLGCIRPVTPRIAEALHAKTQHPVLLDHIRRGCTERWELWELVELLRRDGLDPTELWRNRDEPASDALCRLIPPERFRLYSIASAAASPLDKPAPSLDLVVGHLRYPSSPGPATASPPVGCPMHGATGATPSPAAAASVREGTASGFLARAEDASASIPFHIERAARFQPPRDPATPIVFFAGGTGVSPFMSFLAQRRRGPAGSPAWLLWSLRTRAELVAAAELGAAHSDGSLELDVCFTREPAGDASAEAEQVRRASARRLGERMLEPETARKLWERIYPEDGPGAMLYVCGRSGFARSVVESLRQIFRERAEGDEPERRRRADELLHRLVADNRLSFEVHTDAQPAVEEPRWIDVSEVAAHNEAAAGYWMIVDRVVYDVTEFADMHPGGRRVVEAYSGMDATHGYARAHHQRPEVDAMRDMYRIGMLRTLDFDDYTTEIEGPSGSLTVSCRSAHHAWVQALQLVVEMQNALRADYSLQRRKTTAAETAEEPGLYRLSRGIETHARFIECYQRVIENETLPALWRISQGLFAPHRSPRWMAEAVATLQASDDARTLERVAHDLMVEFPRFASDLPRLRRALTRLEESDLALLARLKGVLSNGVRVFERHERRTRQCGARAIVDSCLELVEVLRSSTVELAADLRDIFDPPARPSSTPPATPEGALRPRRLYTSSHWVFEERPDDGNCLLLRTPAPWACLGELRAENATIIGLLRDEHRARGLLVDMRQAPTRNDVPFESAMAALRSALTQHFKRVAVLLESNLGELQVARLGRDERQGTFATRCESTAHKFLAGGR
jgi:sulfite reductase alpha subunit-like flavoprotein